MHLKNTQDSNQQTLKAFTTHEISLQKYKV